MLAVIGGSGVYDIGGLANKRWVKVESPFGAPSALTSCAKPPPIPSSPITHYSFARNGGSVVQ